MVLELPELPFAKNDLEPHMTANTLDFHYGKHHQAYVTKGNELLGQSGINADNLEDLVIAAAKEGGALFNNVGQHYNHSFFWNSLSQNGGGAPSGEIASQIDKDFGDFDTFKTQFIAAGAGQFGSGWVWLVLDEGTLKIAKTANADTPLTEGKTPILVCDVWEHAYYLDYQNRRPDFLKAFIDNMANWQFANQNLANN